jgi:signal transduction histidine kinase
MKFDHLRGYGIAIGSVPLVGALRLAATPLVHNRLSSSFFLLAVILTARYGGFGPSWLALVLGALASAYLHLPGVSSVGANSLLAGYMLVYCALGMLLVFLSRSERAGRRIGELSAAASLKETHLETQEREKQALCYEIHDGLIQYATGALLLLDGYRRAHPTAKDADTLARVSDGLRQAVEEGRRVIRGLQPSVLDEAGIVAALEDLVEQTTALGLQVDFHNSAPRTERLSKALETAIYRIVQEALTNASKHSGTDRVLVELGRRNGDFWLEIRDFGRGFDVRAPHGNALGLLGMTERVRLLGGECSIESRPNAGTRITARIPVAEESGKLKAESGQA